jgi:hypothetical protein
MSGERLEAADLGWHGLEGDRRLALARSTAELLKSIVRVRDNKAGVYRTVIRRGRLAVGQSIFFDPAVDRRHL